LLEVGHSGFILNLKLPCRVYKSPGLSQMEPVKTPLSCFHKTQNDAKKYVLYSPFFTNVVP